MKRQIEKLNRKIPPPVRQISQIHLPEPRRFELDNGIPVYETRLGDQDVMKLEIVYLAGTPQEHKRLASRASLALIKEGTVGRDSATISETLDFYAGALHSPVSMDYAAAVLYCMTKHFEPLLPMLAEMLYEPVFPTKELEIYKESHIQNLHIELAKNDTIAYREITELIFGKEHPYGFNSVAATYEALQREDLMRYHAEQMTSDNAMIFISGKTSDQIIRLLNRHIGQKKSSAVRRDIAFAASQGPPQKIRLKNAVNPDTSQAAIRIGRKMFPKTHPDFTGMFVLNTVLGGYFGSRLMTNIREQSGFTYNIYSSLDNMFLDGYFYVSTEVGVKYIKPSLKAIYAEMDKLRQTPVGEEELNMVRNYLLGNILTHLDGPFQISDMTKSLALENIPRSYFDEMIESIKAISAARLQELARHYFDPKDMWEVVAGG